MFVTLSKKKSKKKEDREFQSLIGLCDVCDQGIGIDPGMIKEFQSLIGLCDVCDLSTTSRVNRASRRFQSLIGLCDVCDKL